MPTITVEEAATNLPEIIRESPAGEEITLTQNSVPIAKLIPLAGQPRKAGSAAHLPHWTSEDFDDIPEGFEEYMS